jgi:hypothetical protein
MAIRVGRRTKMSQQMPNRTNISSGRFHAQPAIEADVLTPTQYDDLVRRGHLLSGELRLMLAILEDATRCYLRHAKSKDEARSGEFLEVRRWFESGVEPMADQCGIFSFRNLCEALCIEPERLLERLKAMTLADLPPRRYQTRRHRPLASLRFANSRSRRVRARSTGS